MTKAQYIARHGADAYEERARRMRDRHRENAERQRLAPGPARLLCCGMWHTITQLPLTVPCCGAIYLQEGTP